MLIVNLVSNLGVNRLRENSGNGGNLSFSAFASILRVRIRRLEMLVFQKNFANVLRPEAYSEAYQTSKMEPFAKIVDSF